MRCICPYVCCMLCCYWLLLLFDCCLIYWFYFIFGPILFHLDFLSNYYFFQFFLFLFWCVCSLFFIYFVQQRRCFGFFGFPSLDQILISKGLNAQTNDTYVHICILYIYIYTIYIYIYIHNLDIYITDIYYI